MKIFAYVGSYRIESISKKIAQYLCENLSKLSPGSTYSIYSPDQVCIHECQGCTACFQQRECPLGDDFAQILDHLLSADIIVFVSPVYLHHISGSMKTFIDRCSFLTHILACRGKFGICINVSDSNGNAAPENYLPKVMNFLGISVLSNLSLQVTTFQTENALKSIIDYNCRKIRDKIVKGSYEIVPLQEMYFQNIKAEMSSRTSISPEKEYWERNGLFKYRSYRELFLANISPELQQLLHKLPV